MGLYILSVNKINVRHILTFTYGCDIVEVASDNIYNIFWYHYELYKYVFKGRKKNSCIKDLHHNYLY